MRYYKDLEIVNVLQNGLEIKEIGELYMFSDDLKDLEIEENHELWDIKDLEFGKIYKLKEKQMMIYALF